MSESRGCAALPSFVSPATEIHGEPAGGRSWRDDLGECSKGDIELIGGVVRRREDRLVLSAAKTPPPEPPDAVSERPSAHDGEVACLNGVAAAPKEPTPDVQAVNLRDAGLDVKKARSAGLKVQRPLDERLIRPAEVVLVDKIEALFGVRFSDGAEHLEGLAEHLEQRDWAVQGPLGMNPSQEQDQLRKLGKGGLNECVGRLQGGVHGCTVSWTARAEQQVMTGRARRHARLLEAWRVRKPCAARSDRLDGLDGDVVRVGRERGDVRHVAGEHGATGFSESDDNGIDR